MHKTQGIFIQLVFNIVLQFIKAQLPVHFITCKKRPALFKICKMRPALFKFAKCALPFLNLRIAPCFNKLSGSFKQKILQDANNGFFCWCSFQHKSGFFRKKKYIFQFNSGFFSPAPCPFVSIGNTRIQVSPITVYHQFKTYRMVRIGNCLNR